MAFGNTQHRDWKLLREYGMEEQVRERLSVAPWAKLFKINEPAYRDITLEFLSTMKWTEGWFTFQAYGKRHNIAPSSLSLHFGLETAQENMLHQQSPLEITWPENLTPQLFWERLIGAPVRCLGKKIRPEHKYRPSYSKASAITDMDLRVIHHLMAHTIG